jgi:beta-glucosidase/6-phospho-beta-glucosidase/beta-galactosidase
MKQLGIKYFRMSLSWPRLLPDGTTDKINWKGVDFYHKVFNALKEAGITPYVTLYHWDLPSALMKDPSKDGWLNRDII